MSSKNKKLTCEECKVDYDFHMHICKKAHTMYYGCVKCENYCSKCRAKK